jgi:hypothetical protein
VYTIVHKNLPDPIMYPNECKEKPGHESNQHNSATSKLKRGLAFGLWSGVSIEGRRRAAEAFKNIQKGQSKPTPNHHGTLHGTAGGHSNWYEHHRGQLPWIA